MSVFYLIIESHLKIPSYDRGWGNGYVLVPPYHPYYDDVNVEVHYGLTWGSRVGDFNIIKDDLQVEYCPSLKKIIDDGNVDSLKDYWVYGFDTAHHMDSISRWPKEAVWIETEDLYEQFIDIPGWDYIEQLHQRKDKLEKLDNL